MYTLNKNIPFKSYIINNNISNTCNESMKVIKVESESCAQRNKTIFVSLRNLIYMTLCKLSNLM
eukprot:GAHX01005384.1.p1 GENE.GAHX01005384.1~~GAHX01005384.1.p1  ORF type:complete len:64 (-),score=2.12 GAHX01005384.1:443-634(-)